jgi:hypothetical protein
MPTVPLTKQVVIDMPVGGTTLKLPVLSHPLSVRAPELPVRLVLATAMQPLLETVLDLITEPDQTLPTSFALR